MSRIAASLLAFLTILALALAACGKAETEEAPPAGENAAPADEAPPAAEENATAGEEADAAAEAPADAENPKLALLREKAAELGKKIDEYTSTLAGLGDVDALKSQISKLRSSTAVLMGSALEKAKTELARLEAKIAEYDTATNARKTLSRELAEVEAAIRELGGE